MEKKSKIQVVIRKRPLNPREIKGNKKDVISVISYDSLILKE